MFISNTATAAMMLTILIPPLTHIKEDNPFKKTIFLAVMIGANIGGMTTIIVTPPNAIAVGVLGANAPSFAMNLVVSTPPNAIIYASKKVEAKDFLILGLIAGIVGPSVTIAWIYLFENFIY